MIYVEDVRVERRWAQFCTEAADCGIYSLLCIPLWVNDQTLGTLTLYAGQPAAFSDQDVRLIQLFSTLAALALAEAQRTGQLREAITNRDMIGRAIGILMERYHIDDRAAFAVLARTSQHANIKVAVVARHLAETGQLLGTADGPGGELP